MAERIADHVHGRALARKFNQPHICSVCEEAITGESVTSFDPEDRTGYLCADCYDDRPAVNFDVES